MPYVNANANANLLFSTDEGVGHNALAKLTDLMRKWVFI